MAARRARKDDGKDGFLFVGNELVLDFLNTRPVQNGEALELLPDFTALLGWFRAANLLSVAEARRIGSQWGGTQRARETVSAMHALREKLRSAMRAWEEGDTIPRATLDEINGLMSAHPMRSRLVGRGDGHSTEMWFAVRAPEDLFAPLAQSAANLLANADRQRVRQCANCVLHFHDTSKKGTRRWCSMRLCGNRLKVAAYAARQRDARD